jgi:hypothetical protein
MIVVGYAIAETFPHTVPSQWDAITTTESSTLDTLALVALLWIVLA